MNMPESHALISFFFFFFLILRSAKIFYNFTGLPHCEHINLTTELKIKLEN